MITIFSIPGMHCASCAALIKDVSAEFPEIQKVAVDTASKRVTLEHTDGFSQERWVTAIEELGDAYRVNLTS